MRHGRRFILALDLPIDPWPSPSLAERLSIRFVLVLLLIVPFFAAGAALVLVAAIGIHVYRSYDLGASLRAVIDRWTLRAGGVPPAETLALAGQVSPDRGRARPATWPSPRAGRR